MRLINADELKKRLMEMTRFKPNYEIGEPTWGLTRRTSFHMSEIMKVVIDMPTIEERKHGEWLVYPQDWSYDEGTGWKCSLCGNVTYEQNFDYCPYCGARMDEVEE